MQPTANNRKVKYCLLCFVASAAKTAKLNRKSAALSCCAAAAAESTKRLSCRFGLPLFERDDRVEAYLSLAFELSFRPKRERESNPQSLMATRAT